ncbi:metal-dependent hydrolase [Gimesia sp.]|uniref:metal-dependent hydrolase n=1 Tax=Gimesia sp. TaxID=2024833 RepID=UPI000C4299E5|nr:metal-dependent hydrolase [Gimesia sp.]MAX40568.1 metal-dependent hydrolase [Gimesia sp.]HAH44275.1 metal-dependent hydrolase [Planctomycetaceae bacterium]HBL47447.1 metal-dependent hydrolase [Planctomycetaceae bacterium]|tara:strand:+ start:802 stop:1521 length:720 start_codon:yes stop_codon:yes gene_type:complete
MAGYKEHISVSGLLGIGYGTIASLFMGFTPTQGILAGVLTWVGGMLPDLDSETGRPIRELFSLTAAVASFVAMRCMIHKGADPDNAILMAVVTYAAVRYGGAAILSKFAVHRGMFHSIPALIITGETVFLAYFSDSYAVKFLMAGGISLGFLSHLVLDEVYSVERRGITIRLKKSSGSAIKWFGNGLFGNAVAYAILLTMTYITLVDSGVLIPPQQAAPVENIDAPVQQASPFRTTERL